MHQIQWNRNKFFLMRSPKVMRAWTGNKNIILWGHKGNFKTRTPPLLWDWSLLKDQQGVSETWRVRKFLRSHSVWKTELELQVEECTLRRLIIFLKGVKMFSYFKERGSKIFVMLQELFFPCQWYLTKLSMKSLLGEVKFLSSLDCIKV